MFYVLQRNRLNGSKISRQFTKIEARRKQITSAKMSDWSDNSDHTSMRAQSSSSNEGEFYLSWQRDPLASFPEEPDDGMAMEKGE